MPALVLTLLLGGCGTRVNPDVTVALEGPPQGPDSVQAEAVTHAMRAFPNQTQFAIALVSDATARFHGVLRSGDSLKTVDNRGAVYEIGSVSKVFTAYLLARLVAEGELELDRPVRELLDVPLNEDAWIRLDARTDFTLEHLANHTSGLPRIPAGMGWSAVFQSQNPYRNYGEDDLRDYLSEEMLLHSEPGTSFQYSNLGAGLLAYALGQYTGKSYEQMLQERIFGPLDMTHSTTDRTLVADRLVTGLNASGSPTPNWDLNALSGAGAILSTAEEMHRFVEASFDTAAPANRLMQQPTFRINEQMAMGLGWFILDRASGHRWLWHNGGTGGYRSSVVLDPSARRGVVLLTNVSAGHERAARVDSLSFALLESLYETAPADTAGG
ncbi:MAG: serine hydrolase [Balneolaceae bacterium]|nr:serine hydrolase [Balneolaceae bacterium]